MTGAQGIGHVTRMRALALASLVLLCGCSSSHVVVGDHDGGGGGGGGDGGGGDGGGDAGEPRSCGGFAGLSCEADEFCDFPDSHMCGITDGAGTCAPRPGGCSRVLDPHCGCDGTTYSNACVANAAGVDTLHRGPCEGACEPDDAQGEGLCDAIVGIAWNGRACVHLSGCSCVGSDCGRWSTIEQCQTAHAMCPIPL